MRAQNRTLRRLFRDIKRRKVLNVAVTYVAAGLAATLAATELYDDLLLPEWTPRLVVVFFSLGLPVALVAAWASEAKPGWRKRLTRPAGAPDVGGGPALDTAERPSDRSLVVVPFENVGGDPAQDLLCVGMTEDLIASLSCVRSLQVIARTSALLLRGKEKDVEALRRALGVRHVLFGRVARAGERLRVTAQLVDSTTGERIWVERYDGDSADVPEIQERMVQSIAGAMGVAVTSRESESISAKQVQDPAAYEYLLRARHAVRAGTDGSAMAATGYLETALEIVGDDVALLNALGEVSFHLAHAEGEGMDDLPDRLEDIADRIFRRGLDCGAGHLSRGLAFMKRPQEFPRGLQALRLASELDPANANILLFRGFFAAEAGWMDEALRISDALVALDPLSPVVRLSCGYILMLDGQLDGAICEAEEAFHTDPRSPSSRLFLMLPLIHAGRWEEAMGLAAEMPGRPHDNWGRCVRLYEAALRGEESDAPVDDELIRAARRDETFSWMLAECLGRLGRKGEAMDWLENAVSFGFTNTRFLAESDALLAPLREEPRFQALMDRAEDMAQTVRAEPGAATL